MKLYLYFILTFFTSCAQNGENTITIIPENYTGPICINFNVESGLQKEYEANDRVYKIDEHGLLNTQFEAILGQYQFNKYYYQNSNGKRQEIEFINMYDKSAIFNKDSIYIFGEEHSSGGSGFDENGEFTILPQITMYIGKYEDVEKKLHQLMVFGDENNAKVRK